MRRARLRVLFVFAVFASWVVPAGAETPSRVVILEPENEQDGTALELLARVRGELSAAGLEVIAQPVPPDAYLRVAVEVSSPELAPAAVIAVHYLRPVPPEIAGAEVWISDRLSNTTLMQVVRASPQQANPAARLAVQVAEVVKARLALLWVKPNPILPAPPPPTAPLPPAEAQRATEEGSDARRGRLLFGLGLGLAHHVDGGVSSWLPSLHLGYDLPQNGWSTPSFRLSGAWTPDETTLERSAGAAHIQQTLFLAQASLRFLPRAAIQPLVSAALGAFRARVRGESREPYTATTSNTWSAATTLGAGLWLQPAENG